MKQKLFPHLSAAIHDATHHPFEACSATAVGGGSINESFRLEGTSGECYFLKLNDAQHHKMFEAEAAGLDAITATNTVRVPQPIANGIAGERSFLVLEYMELSSRGDAKRLGKQLAAMHRNKSPPLPCRERAGERVVTLHYHASSPIPQGRRSDEKSSCFGFAHNNFIGTTPQPNGWGDNWITFWREQRLGFQLKLAAEKGYGGQLQCLGEKLLDALPAFFAGYTPQPSLLHGDLWSGNHAFTADGAPTIFDPAAYYGDRECDIAMTELFGGFPTSFYVAYRAEWPLHAGYETRRDLYNLYHILNHANLFGEGYATQAEQMMKRLLSVNN